LIAGSDREPRPSSRCSYVRQVPEVRLPVAVRRSRTGHVGNRRGAAGRAPFHGLGLRRHVWVNVIVSWYWPSATPGGLTTRISVGTPTSLYVAVT